MSWGKANFTLDNAANSVTLSFQVKDSDIGVTDPGLGKIDINLNDHPTLTSASASVGERTTCVTLGSGAKVALSNVKGDSSVVSIPHSVEKREKRGRIRKIGFRGSNRSESSENRFKTCFY